MGVQALFGEIGGICAKHAPEVVVKARDDAAWGWGWGIHCRGFSELVVVWPQWPRFGSVDIMREMCARWGICPPRIRGR
jgi:hypothetical protein